MFRCFDNVHAEPKPNSQSIVYYEIIIGKSQSNIKLTVFLII